MSNVPRLNYFVENENAESATKNFAVILQKAFEQYRKLWDKYLDLLKKYEGDSTTCEQVHKTWKEKNVLKSAQVLSENMDIFNKCASEIKSLEEEKKTCDGEENEDIFEVSDLDYDSDIYDSICQSQTPNKKTKNIILPESPVFMRKDEKSISTIYKNEISNSNDNISNSHTMETDDRLDFNKQNNDDSFVVAETHINNISFNSYSPAIVCNTPIGNNECYRRNKQKLLKKQITCKSEQDSKENTISPKKQQVNKKNIPLQALENFISPSKVSLNQNGNRTRTKGFTECKHSRVSPESKKLKQTTLTFHTIKNKVDNAVVTSAEKSIPITKCKKFLFKYKSYTKSTLCQNEVTNDKKIDFMYVDKGNNRDETIYEDIIANSPNSIYMQPQKKNSLKLKRKFSDTDNTQVAKSSKSINEFDSAFTSPHTSPMRTQHQTCLTNKKNISSDSTICFTSEIIAENAKKCLKPSKDTKFKQEPIENNDFDETASIVHQESNLSDVSQFGNEDETYFEDHIEEENNININRELAIYDVNYISPTHKTLTNIHYTLENPRENITKGTEIKTKEGWSCWECTEYYKNKPNLSETHVQKWKNQCSRHRNVYYAGQATPEGFWDPLFPSTASDSTQET